MSTENIKRRRTSGKSPIVNVRIPREDMDAIRAAAKAKAVSYSGFIRAAAILAAREVNAESVSAS